MNGKRKETGVEIRNLIVKLREDGKSYGEIAKTVKKCRATIQSIIKKYEETGNSCNQPRSGRPKVLNNREIRLLIKKVKKDPKKSAPTLAAELATETNKRVHAETVRRILRCNGFHGRTPRRKPLISKVNQQKRLTYALKYQNETSDFWKQVLFTDESKFNIYGCDGRGKVWRKANEELKLQNMTPTVKHGGGSVMVWGSMAAAGVGNLCFIEGTMDQMKYLEILRVNLQPSVERLGLGRHWIFQHDSDPKHTAYNVRQWLLYNVPKTLDHPPQSPDLNPIEHIWDELDRRIRVPEVRSTITDKHSLKTALERAWSTISADVTENLVLSMPRRLQAVINAKGGPTKY